MPSRHVQSTPEMGHSSQQSFEDAVMDLDSSSEWEADSDDLSDSDRDDLRGGDDEEEDDEDEQGDRPFELNPSTTSSLIDLSLPPVTSIQDMAAEMVGPWLPVFLDLAEKLGRPIRIVTICSGTDPPVLFLLMIEDIVNKALVNKGSPHRLKIHHVAACESDRKKADFIEKNSKPDMSFKSAVELGSGAAEATLWSGEKAAIPGDIDLVIAGPSCVDYSPLNLNRERPNWKGKGKDVGDGKKRPVSGQSTRTWDAVVGYVKNHLPRTLLVENVQTAPWPEMCATVGEIGYSVEKMLLNSTDFFLPCNRPRGYMIAFLNPSGRVDASHAVGEVMRIVEDMKRPPSLPAEAFLSSTGDDEPVQSAAAVRPALASQVRQAEFSAAHNLGHQQPLRDNERWKSRIEPDVLASMSERAIGGIETLILKYADQGRDLFELDAYIVVSNSTQFRTKKPRSGVCPCLTTRGRIFSTRLHRCLTAAEHLKLQGFPVEQLDFEGISYAVVKDMAGNAMALPVVGAVMMAALVVAWTDTALFTRPGRAVAGVRQGQPQPTDPVLGPVWQAPPLAVNYRRLTLAALIGSVDRAPGDRPGQVDHLLRRAVPPALVCQGIRHVPCHLQTDGTSSSIDTGEQDAEELRWLSRLEDTISQPFRLVPVEVGIPILSFESSSAVLEVDVLNAVPQAHIFTKLQAGDLLRPSSPVATLLLPADLPLVDGLLLRSWTLHPPCSATSIVAITGHGQYLPSFESDLGLPQHASKRIPRMLNVSRDGSESDAFSGLLGSYEHVVVRGCTPGSTWMHTTADPPIYLTLRTDTLECSTWTGYVFTHRPRPVPHGTPLLDLARCDPGWRPLFDRPSEVVTVSLGHVPLPAPDVCLSIPSLPVVEVIKQLPTSPRPLVTVICILDPAEDHSARGARTESLVYNGVEALRSIRHLLKDINSSAIKPMGARLDPVALRPTSSAGEAPFLFHREAGRTRIAFDTHFLALDALSKLPERKTSPPQAEWTLNLGYRTALPPAFQRPVLVPTLLNELGIWVGEQEGGVREFAEKEIREVTFSPDLVRLRARGIASQVVRPRGGILVGGIGDVKAMRSVVNLLLPPPAPPKLKSERLSLFIVSALYDWDKVITLPGRGVLRIKDHADLGRFSSQTPDLVEIVLIKESLLQTIMATSARMTPRARGSLVEIHSVNMMSKLQRFRWYSLIYVSPLPKLSSLWVEWVRSLTVEVRWIWRPTSAVDDMDAIKQTAALFDVYLQEPYRPSPKHRPPRNSVITSPADPVDYSFLVDQGNHANAFIKLFVRRLVDPPPKTKPTPKKKAAEAASPEDSTSADATRSSKRPRTAAPQAELDEEEKDVEVGQAGPGPSTMADRALATPIPQPRVTQPQESSSPGLATPVDSTGTSSGAGTQTSSLSTVSSISTTAWEQTPSDLARHIDEVAEDNLSGETVMLSQMSLAEGPTEDFSDEEWPEMTASGRFA